MSKKYRKPDIFKVGDSAWFYGQGRWWEWMVRERTRSGYVMQRRDTDAEEDQTYDIVLVRTQVANKLWATLDEMKANRAFMEATT